MHRTSATAGSWQPQDQGTTLIEQTAAPLVFLSAADTEIQALAAALEHLPVGLGPVRAASLLQLSQQVAIDHYAETVLAHSRAIVLRLLGGRAYWSYGLEVVCALARERGIALAVLPGDEQPDLELLACSTVDLAVAERLWRYCRAGGPLNLGRALQLLCDCALGSAFDPGPPVETPRSGLYEWGGAPRPGRAPVGVLFYRAHLLSGNTAAVDALCAALDARDLQARPIFVNSLRDPEATAQLKSLLADVQCLINTTSFSLARLPDASQGVEPPELWAALDVPVLQAIFAGCTRDGWQAGTAGLGARDVAMNIALPEVDGRIVSRAVSFKHTASVAAALEAPLSSYRPEPDRVAFVAALAERWVALRRTPVPRRRIALVLANYPNRDGRLANGVGLDTPASCAAILAALAAAGYDTGPRALPADGDALMAQLTAGLTNDPEGFDWRPLGQWVPFDDYERFFATLPMAVQEQVRSRWGPPPGEWGVRPQGLPVSGVRFGNLFVGIQPARGYDADPAFNYHAPDLEPPHPYFAFYHWLRDIWGAQAIVHVGKHGNLEWLPGKANALGPECFPEAVFGAMPHLYPFIVNDPGEGSQAKRRTQAVIVDHLTPPMARAETYGDLLDLENLIDEYHEAASLDPDRLPVICSRLAELICQTQLHRDFGRAEPPSEADLPAFLTLADGYLCELKEAQIRDGLHILGQAPMGEQRLGLLAALARVGSNGRPGLTQALARDLGLEFDPLAADGALPYGGRALSGCRTVGDAIEQLEAFGHDLLAQLPVLPEGLPATCAVLAWVRDFLAPALAATTDEITALLHGLAGGFVPPGPSGAPTRGRPEVLPTGRNFFSVDLRALPTPSAWDVGRRAAEALVERYTQDCGEYPRAIGLSIWGTSTMRTGGDDLAQALALLGVQPVWDRTTRRVIDFEILPVGTLGRPRVDVTLRVSGFFRDAFANLIDLFHSAVLAVTRLEEPEEDNPLAAAAREEAAEGDGLFRVFGPKPGAYGAGLQGLIDSQAWQDEADLARAYLNWSGYAYTGKGDGVAAPTALARRLRRIQAVLHNQDNREHDLLDSDDYYQFQGGMTVASRVLAGRQPKTYFGDHSRPQNPKVRALGEEVSRVYRSRVVNPKWIAGMLRHGYKGAFELAATVDYLFAYDATARCVEDFMYQGVAERYLFDPVVQDFVRAKNPWVLRDMAERLLEAHQRELWQDAPPELLTRLRELVLSAEESVESRGAPQAESS
ncbi:cobaltochelatase subunit CobN [Gloeobacter morelensis]|uniref:Cobaltochelatase subunit CobN n=1 Tax=Gloeobacter morelensis MG652769 TaxID=2781736 RepID=A0ABY3PP86_9CYAN|nr:cobaltochelatase subunit CobN [Gloeobacter morelensis]UFP95227.1 cobaltochelatase subunit CobN [Gloeobacter morelensis MG652769]